MTEPVMTEPENAFAMSRRLLLAGAGMLGACSVLPASRGKSAAASSELEISNEKLVNGFCADWSKRDVEVLVPYLANDFVYQMFEGRPDLIGVAAFRKEVGPFLAKLESVHWDMLRSFALGPIVINERVDHFVAPAGGRSMHFPIAGLFVVKNSKIVLWRDYLMPGGKSVVG